ncbi:hypothetical protein BDZ91DRAFT_801129 [Kalaharituber pfeilii]|nr:hypothetical protein BDZ91DRAFT_801129 [Kalaharituber pfeilii]
MAGKIVKKSGATAAATAAARAPIHRKVVRGIPSYMQPTLASKAKAKRGPLVGEEPNWFDVMHHIAAWVTSLEPCFDATVEECSLNVPEENLCMSRASSVDVPSGGRSHVPRGSYQRLHGSSRIPVPSTSSVSSLAISSGGRSHIPRGNYQKLHGSSHIPAPSISSISSRVIPSGGRSHIPRGNYQRLHGSSHIPAPSGGRSHIPRGNYNQLHGRRY